VLDASIPTALFAAISEPVECRAIDMRARHHVMATSRFNRGSTAQIDLAHRARAE
jgi:hypothetical protein